MASKVAISTPLEKEYKKLGEELRMILEETKRNNYKVLHANLLEIEAQYVLKSIGSDFSQKKLSEALHIINDPDSKDNLFIRKWILISKKPDFNSSQEIIHHWQKEMNDLIIKAKELNHYETLRDIDYHLSFFNFSLGEKVFYGTPYEFFRKRLLDTHKKKMPDSYLFKINRPHTSKYIFDYHQYKELRPGSIILKVIMALCNDFYRPSNKFSLFEYLFPKDFYNPQSSFNKIHQAIFRTRSWLKKNHIPLLIEERNQEYLLVGNASIKLYLKDRLKILVEKSEEVFLSEFFHLSRVFLKNQFTLKEAMKILGHPNPRKTQRLLKLAVAKSLAIKMNKGKNTMYAII